MNNPAKISVVTVSYNQGRFIRQNIESVLQQNYPHFEHIIVDGGSTDDTLQILKSYPHLNWVSEADRGQSHALNKGFAKATGDIVVWLNSDDWLAPNVFPEIIEGLKHHPIIMSSAAEADDKGVQQQVVANTSRNYFDLLKYWVPLAWLAQTSVFFRRSLLEQIKRSDGSYVDEGLYFCMDYDVWMRLAALAPFVKISDRPFSFFRMYGENKTGKFPLATQRECARVCRRHSSIISNHERKISYVILLNEVTSDIVDTLTSIAQQTLEDGEVLFVDYADSKERHREIRDLTFNLGERFNHINMRYECAARPNIIAGLNRAIETASALLLCFLEPGDKLPTHFALETANIFSRDVTGLALTLAKKPEVQELFYDKQNNNLKTEGVLGYQHFSFPHVVVRKTALLDIGGFKHEDCPPLSIREFLVHSFFKGWHVSIKNTLSVDSFKKDYSKEDELLTVAGNFFNAKIISDRVTEAEVDPFAQVRIDQGVTPKFISNAVQSARGVIQSLAPEWTKVAQMKELSELEKLASTSPIFAPAWYYLAKAYEAKGQIEAAQRAKANYAQLVGQ